jgi:hypothetical protein
MKETNIELEFQRKMKEDLGKELKVMKNQKGLLDTVFSVKKSFVEELPDDSKTGKIIDKFAEHTTKKLNEDIEFYEGILMELNEEETNDTVC